jgi:hypothetical protein
MVMYSIWKAVKNGTIMIQVFLLVCLCCLSVNIKSDSVEKVNCKRYVCTAELIDTFFFKEVNDMQL